MKVISSLLVLSLLVGALLFIMDGSPPAILAFLGMNVVLFVALAYSQTGRRLSEDLAVVFMVPIGIVIQFVNLVRLVRRWLSISCHLAMALVFGRTRKAKGVVTVPSIWSDLVASTYWTRRLRAGWEVVLGYNNRRVVTADLRRHLHILITGKTGVGKTTVTFTMIATILKIFGASFGAKYQISIHDSKGGLGPYFDFLARQSESFGIFTDREDSAAELERIIEIIRQRMIYLRDSKTFDIDRTDLPRILVFLEEPQLWFPRHREYEELVMKVVTTGRQAGVVVILTTPYGVGSIINTTYRPNFDLVSGQLPRHAVSVVGMPGVVDLAKSEFLFNVADIPLFFRTYHITPEDVEVSVDAALATAISPFDMALQIFFEIPDCGIRTLLTEMIRRYEVVAVSPPPPFDNVSEDETKAEGLAYTRAARDWANTFFETLENLGIVSGAEPGKARKPLVSYNQAKAINQERIKTNA